MEKTDIYFRVSQLSWERVFLHFEISTNCEVEADFYLERFEKLKIDEHGKVVGLESKERIPLLYNFYKYNRYNFVCNITAFHGRAFLNNGQWRIVAQVEGKEYSCYIAHDVAYQYDEKSRIFPYGKKYAYNIYFSTVTEEETHLWFVMNSFFMVQNDTWKKRRYVQEAKTLKEKLIRVSMTMAILLLRCFYQFWEQLFPKKGNRVLLMSETRDYLWGNLKSIDEGMRKQGLDQKFRIEYSFRKAIGNHNVFSWVKIVFKIAQQDYIFVDDYVPIFGFLKLNKRTKLIQVWHAGEGFKAVGYCRFGKDGSPFPTGSCHKQYDYALTGSEKLVKVFAEVFGIEEDALLPVGMPRLDGFLDPKKIESFRQSFYDQYPQFKEKKIILFAPTYRGTGQQNAYYDYSWLDLQKIYDFCGTEYVFLVKMHPFVKKEIEIPEHYKEKIIDFGNYSNINDLYYVTDLLITDYSSNYFEFSLMKKPVLFFTPDRELYELSRGVHRSVKDSAPGKVCDTFEEMMKALMEKDFEVEKIHQFVKDNFANYDGQATHKALQYIFGNQDM